MPQDCPKRHQEAPERSQESPKTPQDGPQEIPIRPKTPQDCPKRHQEAPKRSPGRCKMPQNCPEMAHTGLALLSLCLVLSWLVLSFKNHSWNAWKGAALGKALRQTTNKSLKNAGLKPFPRTPKACESYSLVGDELFPGMGDNLICLFFFLRCSPLAKLACKASESNSLVRGDWDFEIFPGLVDNVRGRFFNGL